MPLAKNVTFLFILVLEFSALLDATPLFARADLDCCSSTMDIPIDEIPSFLASLGVPVPLSIPSGLIGIDCQPLTVSNALDCPSIESCEDTIETVGIGCTAVTPIPSILPSLPLSSVLPSALPV